MIYRRLWFTLATVVPIGLFTAITLLLSIIYYFIVENRKTRCFKGRDDEQLPEVELKTVSDAERDELQLRMAEVAARRRSWKWQVACAIILINWTWLMFTLIIFDHVMFAWGFPLTVVVVCVSWIILLPPTKEYQNRIHFETLRKPSLVFIIVRESVIHKWQHRRGLLLGGIISFIVIIFCMTFFLEGLCIASSPYEVSTRFSRRFMTNFCEGDKPCHVYLTYAEDPAHSIFVNFQTAKPLSSDDNAIVYYDTVSHKDIDSNFGSTYSFSKSSRISRYQNWDIDRGVHWSYLTNLLPSTVYYFRVGYGDDPAYFTSEQSFLTAPISGPYRFVSGGDVAVSQISIDMHKHAAATNPLFALVGGDIEYSNGMESCYRRMDEFIYNWETYMVSPVGHLIPIVLAIGNHEVGGFKAYFQSASTFFFKMFPQSVDHDDPRSLDEGDLFRRSFHVHSISNTTTILMLDSDVVERSDTQVPFMKANLASRPINFASYHLPMYPSHRPYDGPGSKLLRDNWLSVFDEFNLTVAFENHDHMYKRTKLMRGGEANSEGTLYIGDGSWGVPARTLPDDDIPPEKEFYLEHLLGKNFVIAVEVHETFVNLTAFDPNGTVFDSFVKQV